VLGSVSSIFWPTPQLTPPLIEKFVDYPCRRLAPVNTADVRSVIGGLDFSQAAGVTDMECSGFSRRRTKMIEPIGCVWQENAKIANSGVVVVIGI
jgi:hypothetical protein